MHKASCEKWGWLSGIRLKYNIGYQEYRQTAEGLCVSEGKWMDVSML